MKTKKRFEDKTKKINKKLILKILVVIFLVSAIIFGICLGVSAHTWKTLAKDMLVNKRSVIVDTEGNKIATLGDEKDKRIVNIEDMPKNLINAYVAIEDERFYSHHGIDIKRTGAAIVSYVIHFGSSSYGGSTITQQLVKNLTGDSTDSMFRKIKEWWKAWLLETCADKQQILEGYLNAIYVGPNIYGVGGGANYYFSKPASDLSLAECAYLAGINNSPNSYNPFSDEDNSEKIEKRTKTVLAKMKELNYIDESSYNSAVNELEEGLAFKQGSFIESNEVFSYHTDALIPEITEDISKKYNISKTFAENYLELAGLTIHSTQKTSIQKQTETEFEKSRYSIPSKKGNDSSQSAMVIMDHKTGEVLACCGGLGTKTKSRVFNRATQTTRQTGSSSKPLAILVPAIKKRKVTAATIFDDTERDFKNGYHPVDYSTPLGKITVRRAVESSQNVPFVEMIEKIGPSTSANYLKKMGVTSLTKKDKDLPLALGGLDKGISPLEMAGAYSTIANDGKYIEPTFYTDAEKPNGKQAIKSKQKTKKVFSKQVAYVLKDLLKQPVEGANGTATYCKISGVDVAAKTGTTDENYDRWLCGFTPYYTAVTWFGYDKNETVEFNKRNPAGLIWANVMARIHAGLESKVFEKPVAIDTVTICADSGKVARTGCKNTYKENFLMFTTPGLCDKHTGDKVKTDNTNKNTTSGTIPGISVDIDGEEPQRTSPIVEEKYEENTSTTTNTTNTNKQNTTTTNTNKNQNTNTNTSTNTNNQPTTSGGSSPPKGNNTTNSLPSSQTNTSSDTPPPSTEPEETENN